ncbi:MAG: hypothetical protein ABJB01_05755 [Rudaea sp.]
MNRFPRLFVPTLFFCWCSIGSVSAATEFCNPIIGPTRFVGDMASDSKCTDDDIQSAIQATATNGSSCPAKIFITREHTYTDQHLTISNTGKNITLIGQGDGVLCGTTDTGICIGDCPPPPGGPLVTISGRDGDSVIHIDGANDITLRNLQISGGTVSDRGGGIYFDGTGSLKIDRSTVSFNTAGIGAGIDFTGDGGSATLTLGTNALVTSNNANSGGGIRVAGNARLFALQSGALLAFNHADSGYGGGLEIVGPARADLGAAGYGTLPLVYLNTAQYGGGISVEEGGTVRLFATDANQPIAVSSNTASATGGGIFLEAGGASNVACLSSFRMSDNIAQEGVAIYADQRALVGINAAPNQPGQNNTACAIPEDQVTLGAVACAPGVACNQFVGNKARNGSDATDGAILLAQTNTTMTVNRFSATNNVGGHVIRSVADDVDSHIDVYNCLLANNTLTQEVFAMTDGDNFGATGSINFCTIVGNTIGAFSKVILGNHVLNIQSSIVYQPGVETVDFQGQVFNAIYVLSNDMQTLPARVENILAVPLFVDAAHGDYHLLPTSPGIDFAPYQGGLDLDGKTRTYNLPVVDHFGPMDLGAYETLSACAVSDTLFCNGFDP